MTVVLDEPIVLFCSERSGSNLIAKILDAHPEVCAPGAAHLFRVLDQCAARYPPGSAALRQAALALFRAKVSAWKIDCWSDARLMALLKRQESASEMAAALYAAEARHSGKPHVLLKENSAHEFLPAILRQARAPRLLWMVRDPRDMALSWINGPVMRGGAIRAAERWQRDQQGYLSATAERAGRVPVAFLRYEDLLAKPEAELRRICRALRLDFFPVMLRFFEVSDSAKADAARSAMWANLGAPLLSDNAGKFRNGLDDDQIAYVEALAGPYMRALGYESVRDGRPPFGRYHDLASLRERLQAQELDEKPSYQALPRQERDRFENWSRVHARLTGQEEAAPQASKRRA
ncbi:sulfotransferase [Pseudooceanicola sp. HF7]|uniref:sulfotransferase family protein n=1 Tax=Pseudooceanicola sp. HF7 TaxID=2721560 RepID=UPI0014317634|nr:sulfotransferase [Pseudooceanicola sp. HF7]